ncbi:MAG: cyclic pyranopterin monophosphate synthase MoaC [Planctomycetota bacterium]
MELSHFDAGGRARMVDVGSKMESSRRAVATALVRMKSATQARIEQGQIGKGDVLAVARLAGIQAAKQTALLIPLCHPLRLDGVELDFEFSQPGQLSIRATVRVTDRTGVEMEALTAVSVAALTVYDMCKGIDREMEIAAVRLQEKTGGKSGDWRRQEPLGDNRATGGGCP